MRAPHSPDRNELLPLEPLGGSPSRRRSAYASTVAPLKAASIAATSIFRIGIMASNARFAAALSGLVVASSRTRGVICQEKPHRSLHQPQALSSPPLSTIAFQ